MQSPGKWKSPSQFFDASARAKAVLFASTPTCNIQKPPGVARRQTGWGGSPCGDAHAANAKLKTRGGMEHMVPCKAKAALCYRCQTLRALHM
mmetsp:Transcript_124240/g.215366  ORF Transcript_124240/g.215366 Transcript_124240/m.215366 type:complete len:92 (-) Transcript_124240:774-1049(-)